MDRKQKNESDLEQMVAASDASAYEALQLYRSKCNRFKQKGDFIGALGVASKGTKVLLTGNYENAGLELAMVFAELLMDSGLDINPDIRNMINVIDGAFEALPTSGASEVALTVTTGGKITVPKSATTNSRIEFLKQIISWNIKFGTRAYGDPMIHLMQAHALWKRSRLNHRKSLYEFAVGESPQQLWQKILEDYGNAESDQLQLEREYLVVLAILHFLALENLRDANWLFKTFTSFMKQRVNDISANKKKGNEDEPIVLYYNAELIKFCEYLLQTCTRDAAPLFKQLCNAYSAHLNFDPIISSLLTGPIGVKLFNIPVNQAINAGFPGLPGLGGPDMMQMMQNMMGMMGGAGGNRKL